MIKLMKRQIKNQARWDMDLISNNLNLISTVALSHINSGLVINMDTAMIHMTKKRELEALERTTLPMIEAQIFNNIQARKVEVVHIKRINKDMVLGVPEEAVTMKADKLAVDRGMKVINVQKDPIKISMHRQKLIMVGWIPHQAVRKVEEAKMIEVQGEK